MLFYDDGITFQNWWWTNIPNFDFFQKVVYYYSGKCKCH